MQKENFKNLLKHLKFKEKDHIFSKTFEKANKAILQVDFKNEKITYPENLKINEKQTCNFSSAENFVVFECVHRLLKKGYHPEHLELEPKWKLGHGQSGGRADILVRNQENKSLLIIECKTWDKEYDKEKDKMLSTGGQLFSYLQQERSTQYLCLYASTFEKDEIIYENAIVKIKDRKEDKADFEAGNKKIKLYEKAKNNKELFTVWKESFNCYFHYNGIFEYDVNAYEIELKPLKRKDLKKFPEANKIFNTFMEILRHNNISDNANAFNRILSLLLCKIVDEKKAENAVLDFQVKEGEDTAEKIQDRLQKLYAEGMKEHLDEEIVYFEDQKIQDIINSYSKVSKIQQIENIFRQIKYYTQNEFALKEVHNEDLFLQNAKVLNEIIKMLQNYQFRYTKKQQILGDFFELLLNHGVKQNEGQFFTPVPIVRFMILSLGLDTIAKQKLEHQEKNFLPKILDYACGAGHFLTESIDELQHFIEKMDSSKLKGKELLEKIRQYKNSTEWAKDYIFGIEKDYRLARTSQIACFLNGDGDANIIYGDGLENHDRLHLKKGKQLFDVILSNPPYSIKSFKNYLQVGEKEFSLFDKLTEKSKEIENLFLERTTQLLKDGGRAAIILPSSILSNDSPLHFETRKIVLEHFNIKAIASFGSGTFGATGTNTIVLFLEKRNFDFANDRKVVAKEVFNNKKENYLDRERFLKMFLDYRNLKLSDYQTLIAKEPNEKIKQENFYKDYQNYFKKLKPKDFLNEVLAIEQEKFYFFMLTLKDDFRLVKTIEKAYKFQKTIIVQSGEKAKAKAFLGYEFSNRKGNEGIKINRNEKGQAQNKMFDEENYNNPQKANSYILKHFENKPFEKIDEAISEHVKVTKLAEMLDFEKVEVSNAISLNPKINTEITSQYEMVSLENIYEKEQGEKVAAGLKNYLEIGDIDIDTKNYDISKKQKLTVKGAIKVPENTILISTVRPTRGAITITKSEINVSNAFFKMKLNKYVYYCLNRKNFFEYLGSVASGVSYPTCKEQDILNYKIPLPPLAIQKKIVQECEEIDQEVAQAKQQIENAKNEIEKEVQKVVNGGYKNDKIETILTLEYGMSLPENQRIAGDFPVYGSNGIIGMHKDFLVKAPCIIVGRKGSAGEVNWSDKNCTPIDTTFYVKLKDENQINFKFIYHILKSLNLTSIKGGLGSGGINRNTIYNIKIPLPPLEIQKKIVQECEKLEGIITKSQIILDGESERKQQILEKFL